MAFYAEDSASSQAFVSQAKCLAAQGKKFLQSIKSKQVRKTLYVQYIIT